MPSLAVPSGCQHENTARSEKSTNTEFGHRGNGTSTQPVPSGCRGWWAPKPPLVCYGEFWRIRRMRMLYFICAILMYSGITPLQRKLHDRERGRFVNSSRLPSPSWVPWQLHQEIRYADTCVRAYICQYVCVLYKLVASSCRQVWNILFGVRKFPPRPDCPSSSTHITLSVCSKDSHACGRRATARSVPPGYRGNNSKRILSTASRRCDYQELCPRRPFWMP